MKIAIIVASQRQGRATPLVARWIEKAARPIFEGKAELNIVDLNDFNLPIFSEAVSPKYNQERAPEGDIKRWLDELSEADGYIFVTPEYNHSIPGSLKNAIDYIAYETDKKAAAIVGHGTVGGARAIEHLRNIASEIGLVTTPKSVHLVGMVGSGMITDEGDLATEDGYLSATLKATLEQVLWYTEALKAARDQ